MNNSLKIILVIVLALSLTKSAVADSLAISGKACRIKDKVVVEYGKPLELAISAVGVNRIGFAPNIVTNIWGDASEYSAMVSDNGHELFITSRLEAGRDIALAVSLAGGRIVDLMFHITEGRPKIINLNLQKVELKSKELTQEVTQMLKAMRNGIRGKYYVRQLEDKFRINSHDALWASQKQIYQFGKLRGVPLILKNRGKKSVSIDVPNFLQGFNNVIAMQVDDLILAPGKMTKVFLISRHGEN